MVALGRSSCLEIWPGVSVAGPKARFACSHHATPAGTRGQQASSAEIAAVRPATMQGQMKWRLLLPGASEPRLTELNPPGLQDGLSNCVTQPEQPEQSCRWQLLHSPITAEQYREKERPLRPRRSYFAPAKARFQGQPTGGLWWRRRVPPPGPNGLLRRPFISIAGEPALPI